MGDELNNDEKSEQNKKPINPNEMSASDLTPDELRRVVEGDNDNGMPSSGLGNINDSYESPGVKREINDPYLQNAKDIEAMTGRHGLGNVRELHSDGSEGVNSDMILGWFPIYLENMPSSGRFYDDGLKIHIRAARAAEIRHWSTLNERDMFDVDDKLNHIMQQCVRIQGERKLFSWKDILEEDRIFVILAIRELTFKEGENRLQVSKQCPHCGTTNTIDINNTNMQRVPLTHEIEKYYDQEERLYNIATRSYGIIKMKPPTIGVMQVVTKYITKKQQEGGYWDQSYIQLFPYLHTQWRGLKESAIFDGEVDFVGWDEKKYMLMYRLGEKMKVGVQSEIKTDCSGCDEEITAQIDFRDGIKAIFIPTISNIIDELL